MRWIPSSEFDRQMREVFKITRRGVMKRDAFVRQDWAQVKWGDLSRSEKRKLHKTRRKFATSISKLLSFTVSRMTIKQIVTHNATCTRMEALDFIDKIIAHEMTFEEVERAVSQFITLGRVPAPLPSNEIFATLETRKVRHRVRSTGFKSCTRCHDSKERTEFNVDRSKHDGRRTICRDCEAKKREARKDAA